MEFASYVAGQTLPTRRDAEIYARWFFNEFLRLDLGTISAAKESELAANLWAFVGPGMVRDARSREGVVPLVAMSSLAQAARDGIRRVTQGGWYELKEGVSYGIAQLGDGLVKGRQTGTFEDQFHAAVMDACLVFWDRLRDCPGCGTLFLRAGKQKFCSNTCSRRASWERFERHRGPRDHHKEYESRVRKKLGATVKVGTNQGRASRRSV